MRRTDLDAGSKQRMAFIIAGMIAGVALAVLVVVMQRDAAKALLAVGGESQASALTNAVAQNVASLNAAQLATREDELLLAAGAQSAVPSTPPMPPLPSSMPRMPVPLSPPLMNAVLVNPILVDAVPLTTRPASSARVPAASGSVLGPLAALSSSAANSVATVVAAVTSAGTAASAVEEEPLPRAVAAAGVTYCGSSLCGVGSKCCCDQCVPYTAECSPKSCANSSGLSISVACGMNLCASGLVCCNASCGTCVRAGETCSDKLCE